MSVFGTHKLALPFRLELDRLFFDFEFRLFAAVGAFAIGARHDLLGFALGVTAAQPIDQLGANEGEDGCQDDQNKRDEVVHNFSLMFADTRTAGVA